IRLLVWSRPDIDLAMMEVAALPVERAVMRSPGFHDQVMSFPKALRHTHRARIYRGNLIRHAAHEAYFDPSAREIIYHRHLFGDTHRLPAIGNRITEDEQACLGRLSRKDSQHYRRGRIEARGGLMVLVEHNLEPHLLGVQPFVEIPMI